MKEQVAKAERLWIEGRTAEAMEVIGEVYDAAGPIESQRPVVDLLKRMAPAVEIAAANLGMILLQGREGILDVREGVAVLERLLLTTTETRMRGHSHRMLGSAYAGRFGDIEADNAIAAEHFKAGAEAGEDDCAYNYACCIMEGMTDLDQVEAVPYLRRAITGRPGDLQARANLGILLIGDAATFTEGRELLKRTAADGDGVAASVFASLLVAGDTPEGGAEVLKAVNEAAGRKKVPPTLGKHWKPGDAPPRCTPRGLDRAEATVAQIAAAFGVRDQEARLAVAKLHGFRSWSDLAKEAGKAAKGKTQAFRPDEKVDAAERGRRRDHQAYVLKREFELDDVRAIEAAKLLAVTSAEGRPSLRDLDENLAGACSRWASGS